MKTQTQDFKEFLRLRILDLIRISFFFLLLAVFSESSIFAEETGRSVAEFFSAFFYQKISLNLMVNYKTLESNAGNHKEYYEGGIFITIKDGFSETFTRKYHDFSFFINEELESSEISDPSIDKLKKEDFYEFVQKEFKNYRTVINAFR